MAPHGSVETRALACRDGQLRQVRDCIAEEVPVALQYNGISHAVMLASPLDLEDYAVGFSLSEGLVDSACDVFGIEVEHRQNGVVLEIEIAARCEIRLKQRRRMLAGRTGCGLCGVESLDQALPPLPRDIPALRISPAALASAMMRLRDAQALHAATGAVHAAAFCDSAGAVRLVREDVGRHNALDKLVGALARLRIDAAAGFFCVTSRASFEMVQKTACANVGLLAAISAPTSLAIHAAEKAGLCLIGFARGNDWVAYSHEDRLVTESTVPVCFA